MTHPPTEDRREPDALEGCAREIAELAGMSATNVDRIMRRHGLRGPLSDADHALIAAGVRYTQPPREEG